MGALDYLLKNISKSMATEGKVATPELLSHARKVLEPFTEKVPSYVQERVQGNLLNSLASNENIHLADPSLTRAFSTGAKQIPDWQYEAFPTTRTIINNPKEMPMSLGRLMPDTQNPNNSIINYNPFLSAKPEYHKNLIEHAVGTPPHEDLHRITFAGKDQILASPVAKAKDTVADVRGTSDVIRLLKDTTYGKQMFEKYGTTAYDIDPAELAADYFAKHIPFTKDVEGLVGASHNFAMKELEQFSPGLVKRGREQGDKYRSVALPLALGAGAAGALAATPEEGEAGPVNITGLYRGTKKVSRELTADNIARELYNLKDRAAYRAIDNQVGAAQFGDVFPVSMNFKDLFDVRYDPEMAIKIAKEYEARTGKPARQTTRNILTGNWDAMELGEDNRSQQLGGVQRVMMDFGKTGNWQLEPTSIQKNDWGHLGPLVPRRYQDVYATFAKPEISIGEKLLDENRIYQATRDAVLRTKPKYSGGEELSAAEARKEVADLIDPNVLYNGEPLKFFHPDFKPMLEEFRPDAHFLAPDYERKDLFPPSRESFSVKSIREQVDLPYDSDGEAKLKATAKKILGKINDPDLAIGGKFANQMNFAMVHEKFPSSFEPTGENYKKFLKWEEHKFGGLSDDYSSEAYKNTEPIHSMFQFALGDDAVKKLSAEFHKQGKSPKKFDFQQSGLYKDYASGQYTLADDEHNHTFTHSGQKMVVPHHLLSMIEQELAKKKGGTVGDVSYSDIGIALNQAKADVNAQPLSNSYETLNKYIPYEPGKAAKTGEFGDILSFAVHEGKFPSFFKPEPVNVKAMLEWEQDKVKGLSEEDTQAVHDYTANLYDIFEKELGEPVVKKMMNEFYDASTPSGQNKVMSKVDETLYDKENELDPSKLEFHAPMFGGGLFDAVKAMYTGNSPTTKDGLAIKKGIEKVGGYDAEKMLLGNLIHANKLPTWYNPTENSHDKLLDFALGLYDDPNVPEDVKQQIVKKVVSLGGKLTEYGELKKELKETFGDNYSDDELSKVIHNKLAIKDLSVDDAIAAYINPLGGKYGMGIDDMQKYHPEVKKAVDDAYYYSDFVHGDDTIAEAAKKILKNKAQSQLEEAIIGELNEAVLAGGSKIPFNEINGAQDYATKYGPNTIKHLKNLTSLASGEAKGEYAKKLAKSEAMHSTIVGILEKHGYLNKEKEIPGYTSSLDSGADYFAKVEKMKEAALATVTPEELAKYKKEYPDSNASETFMKSKILIDKKNKSGSNEAWWEVFGKDKAALAAAVLGTGLAASHAEASNKSAAGDKLEELGKVNQIKKLDPAVNQFFTGVAERVSHPIDSLVKGDIEDDDPSKLTLAPRGVSKVLATTRKIPGMVGQFAGNIANDLYKGAESAGKLAVGRKDSKGEDFENVLKAAELFFTPVSKAFGTATGVGHDLLFPVETSAAADYTPKAVAQ